MFGIINHFFSFRFEAAEASFELLVHRLLGKKKKFFDVTSVAVRTEDIGVEAPISVAEVKLTAKEKEEFEVAEVPLKMDEFREDMVFFPPQSFLYLSKRAKAMIDKRAHFQRGGESAKPSVRNV